MTQHKQELNCTEPPPSENIPLVVTDKNVQAGLNLKRQQGKNTLAYFASL